MMLFNFQIFPIPFYPVQCPYTKVTKCLLMTVKLNAPIIDLLSLFFPYQLKKYDYKKTANYSRHFRNVINCPITHFP